MWLLRKPVADIQFVQLRNFSEAQARIYYNEHGKKHLQDVAADLKRLGLHGATWRPTLDITSISNYLRSQ